MKSDRIRVRRAAGARALVIGASMALLPWAAGLAPGASAAPKPRPFALEDMLRFKDIPELRVSPDGRLAAFTVESANLEAGRYETDLWVVALDGSSPARAMTTRPGSETSPRWSPDGSRIGFLAKENDVTQVWALPLSGGEAARLTSHPQSIASFDWAPGGRRLLVVAPPAETEEEARRGKERDDAYLLGQHWRNHRVWIVTLGAAGASADGQSTGATSHGAPDTGGGGSGAGPSSRGRAEPKREAEAGPGALTPLSGGALHVRAARWSPDGRRVALIVQPTPEADSSTDAVVQVLEVADPRPRPVPDSLQASAIDWSTEGRALLFAAPYDGKGISREDLFAWEPGASSSRNLSAPLDRDVEAARFRRDGGSIDILYSRGALSEVARVDVETGRLETAWTPGHALDAIEPAGEGWAYVRADRPAEVWVAARAGEPGRALTDLHRETAGIALPSIETARWNGVSPEIEGIVYRPHGHDPRRRYPLIVIPHGGPRLHVRAEFDRQAAYFASRGFVVLKPNFRGSTGYGDAFVRGNVENWGEGPHSDLMAGVDLLVARGLADPDRLFIYGWSYGGYLTNWAIGQTHRFRAAASGAGVADLRMQYVISDARRWRFDYLRGSPFGGDEELYERLSPVTYARLARTPTLFVHGERDARCPLPQGLMMYRALRDNGVETALAVYPREDHGFAEPRHVLDRAKRIADWFEAHDAPPGRR